MPSYQETDTIFGRDPFSFKLDPGIWCVLEVEFIWGWSFWMGIAREWFD